MRCAVIPLCLISVSLTTAHATTYIVYPDGSGDFPTIQAAVDAAVSGDVIELGDGVFSGPDNRDVVIEGKELTIRSQSGDPADCSIDCQGTSFEPHRALHYAPVWELYYGLVEGITFTNGYVEGNGGAVHTSTHAIISFTNCVFRHNRASWGGGLFCVASEGSFRGMSGSTSTDELFCPIIDCRFENNTASCGGGAYFLDAFPGFEDCHFVGNSGGGFGSLYCGMIFEHCSFIDNTGSRGALASDVGFFIFEITRCTFARNSPVAVFNESVDQIVLANNTFWNNGYAITSWPSLPFEMSNSIIANSTIGVFGDNDNATLTCCDLFDNAGGDWVGNIADQLGINGNISADPGFCDVENDDFTVEVSSPCLPGNYPDGYDCGLIGAWGEGCGATAVLETTWGAIKGLYRD